MFNAGHTYGTLTDNTDTVRAGKKGAYLNRLEKRHIYLISKDNLHANEAYIGTLALTQLNTRDIIAATVSSYYM
jgi:hypothetical protein